MHAWLFLYPILNLGKEPWNTYLQTPGCRSIQEPFSAAWVQGQIIHKVTSYFSLFCFLLLFYHYWNKTKGWAFRWFSVSNQPCSIVRVRILTAVSWEPPSYMFIWCWSQDFPCYSFLHFFFFYTFVHFHVLSHETNFNIRAGVYF